MLDTYRAVETPEGVELRLRVAGPAVRLLAWAIDCCLRFIAYFFLAIPLAIFGEVGVGAFFIVLFFGEWFYPVLFEVARGATPGKRQMGLVVLHDDGTPVSWGASMIRNLIRFADFLPLAYGFGLLAMLIHPNFKRLGDLAAGTLVVHWQPQTGVAELPAAKAVPPAVPLALDEQRAIIEFAERLPTWTPQRAAELASLARPLTGASGRQGIDRLLAIASWLVGRR